MYYEPIIVKHQKLIIIHKARGGVPWQVQNEVNSPWWSAYGGEIKYKNKVLEAARQTRKKNEEEKAATGLKLKMEYQEYIDHVANFFSVTKTKKRFQNQLGWMETFVGY